MCIRERNTDLPILTNPTHFLYVTETENLMSDCHTPLNIFYYTQESNYNLQGFF